jgi:tetratricopeptide (TPR) repeat protein
VLPSPLFDPKKDYEDWNDCGPATLALDLRYWGWKGDQQTIRVVVKPERQDKNVNIEELAAYVNQSTAGLQAEIRVGGDLATIQKFIAAGFPVIIEESFKLEKPAWPGDDLWASHFLLITGFDGKAARFTAQDVYYGPDRSVSYNDVVNNWQSFNHVYMVVFPLDRLQQIKNLMGSDWSTQVNAERALDALQSQLKMQPDNAFAWFNLGSSLVALDDYQSADSAFKMARQLGLPKRMLRYQFGPFVAAYQTGDLKDLTQLVDFALKITPDSEEAFYWKGLGALKAGDKQGAALFFRKALEANRNFQDAKNALRGINPL